MIGGITEISTIDYPGKPSMVIFLKGCNLKCPYCHNMVLAKSPSLVRDIPYNEVISAITADPPIEAVTISGGEPLITIADEMTHSHRDTIWGVIKAAKDKGLEVKLDTNGTLPGILDFIISEGMIDYVAMDLKTYPTAPAYTDVSKKIYNNGHWKKLLQSLDVLETHELKGHIKYEIRTTCYPPCIDGHIVRAIARMIPKRIPYYLQRYRKVRSRGLTPYDESQMSALLECARRVHPNTHMRGE